MEFKTGDRIVLTKNIGSYGFPGCKGTVLCRFDDDVDSYQIRLDAIGGTYIVTCNEMEPLNTEDIIRKEIAEIKEILQRLEAKLEEGKKTKQESEIDIQNGSFLISSYFAIKDTDLPLPVENERLFSFRTHDQAQYVMDIIKPIVLLWKIHFGMYGEFWVPKVDEQYWFIHNQKIDWSHKGFGNDYKRKVPFKTQQDALKVLKLLEKLMGDQTIWN